MDNKTNTGVTIAAGAVAGASIPERVAAGFTYTFTATNAAGEHLWTETVHNTVVTEGLNDQVSQYFKGSAYTAAFYVGLTDGTPTVAAGDTMSSHAGWVEVEAYSETERQTLTLGAVAAGSANNSNAKATYTINANGTTIGGGFITTNDTKGGTTGTLYSAAAFTAADKSLDNGDVLSVTAVVQVTSA